MPGRYQPSPSHKFINYLDEAKKLRRLYSQNIDALERAAGIKNLIEVSSRQSSFVDGFKN